jgi:hypothetical protein
MNIFAIYDNPVESAIYLVDKHIVKMPLESAQLLCNAYFINNSKKKTPYNPTHLNHPCSIWTAESNDNFEWLCHHGIELCNEYSERYNRTHKCLDVILFCLENKPKFPQKSMTKFACAMPDEYKISEDPILCYQEYYRIGKKHLHNWKNNKKPHFL